MITSALCLSYSLNSETRNLIYNLPVEAAQTFGLSTTDNFNPGDTTSTSIFDLKASTSSFSLLLCSLENRSEDFCRSCHSGFVACGDRGVVIVQCLLILLYSFVYLLVLLGSVRNTATAFTITARVHSYPSSSSAQ